MSAYALTNDYAAGAAHFVRRGSLHFSTLQGVPSHSFFGTSAPGEEGKWFAAAKDAGLFDEALALASRTPCDPRTLTRAARDYAKEQPAFATAAGLLALHWLVQRYGYEIDGADVWAADRSTLAAAEREGRTAEVKDRIREMVGSGAGDQFVRKVLGGELGLLEPR